MVLTPEEVFELVFWIMSEITVAIIIFVLYHKYSEKKKSEIDARFELGLLIFFIINIVIYIYYIIFGIVLDTEFYQEIVLFVSLISLIIMVFTIEHVILTKNRYILTILYIINFALIFIIGTITGLGYLVPPMSLLNLLLIFLLPIIYFYIAIKNAGAIRKRSLLYGFGFMFTLFGGAFRYEVLVQLYPEIVLSDPTFWHAAPIAVMFLGLCLILYTNVKYLAK